MADRNIVRLFESRKGNLDERFKQDYVNNGIATLPCSISDYNDVISTYSVSCGSYNIVRVLRMQSVRPSALELMQIHSERL